MTVKNTNKHRSMLKDLWKKKFYNHVKINKHTNKIKMKFYHLGSVCQK